MVVCCERLIINDYSVVSSSMVRRGMAKPSQLKVSHRDLNVAERSDSLRKQH